MADNKKNNFFSRVLAHSKIVFPILIVAVLAFTITLALSLSSRQKKMEELGLEISSESSTSGGTEASASVESIEPKDVAFVRNTNETLEELVQDYFVARAEGNEESLVAFYDVIDEVNLYRYVEYGKYVDHYTIVEIYTQEGPKENSWLAYVYYTINFVGHEEEVPGYQTFYVCAREDGTLYFVRGDITDEEAEYIQKMTAQDDVEEFSNSVNAEYSNLVMEKPEILTYMDELTNQVNITVGVRLGQENGTSTGEGSGEETQESSQEPVEEEPTQEEATEPSVEVPKAKQYVVAITTVNVRSSDSEKADRVGRVTNGTKLEFIENLVNGWTKVIYEGSEAYIKSEFLQLLEPEEDVIGYVTSTTVLNIRKSPDQSSERIGVLSQGDSAELLSEDNGWCQIRYNGQIGYVKSEFVQK